MEKLHLLAVALGLAALAGINLYLTVFATGLAIHFHWIALAPQYQSLEVLGNPWIITIAGVLYFLEFFADTRLASNSSPEPFSNIGLSLGEDAAVLGGLALVHFNPVLALVIFLICIGAFFYFAPRILRAMKVKIWLAWRKLNGPADHDAPVNLPSALPARLAPIFARENVLGETILWAVPCVSGRGRRIPANLFGALVATSEEPRRITFVARKAGRPFARTIDLKGFDVGREPKFLSENLVIFSAGGKGPKYMFVFARPHAALVEQIVQDLHRRLSEPAIQEQVAAESASPAG